MRVQNRRVTSLEAKAGTGVESVAVVVREIYAPSPDGPRATGEYHNRLTGVSKLSSHVGEGKEAFERNVTAQETKQ